MRLIGDPARQNSIYRSRDYEAYLSPCDHPILETFTDRDHVDREKMIYGANIDREYGGDQPAIYTHLNQRILAPENRSLS